MCMVLLYFVCLVFSAVSPASAVAAKNFLGVSLCTVELCF
jgi:hypothetical protein